MTTSQPLATPPPLRSILRAPLVLSAWLLLSVVGAQSLPTLLPDDVALAVGLHGLEDEADRLQPFLDEAERLGLVDSLGAAVPSEAEDAMGSDDVPEIPDAFAELELLDLIGREAWFAVSASPFQPLPAATLIARVSDRASQAFETAIADAADRPGTEQLSEGDATFYTFLPDMGDEAGGPEIPVAYAQVGEIVVLSTDPEVVRFVLRAQAGGDEPSLADSDLYRAMRDVGDGQVYGLLDIEPLTDGLAALAESFGASTLLERVQAALETAGPTVGVAAVDDAGLNGAGLRLPRADGADPALYALLTEGTAPGPDVLRYAPEGSLAVSAGSADLRGWWTWLDDVLAAGAELGVPTATEALQLVGVDIETAVLGWAGDRWASIQTAPVEVSEAGASDAPLLGEQVLLIASDDDAAARTGITTLFQALGASLAGFMSPSGQAMVAPETVQIAGTDVIRLPLSDTLALDAAVVDGWVVLSGSGEATEAALTAHASGAEGPETLLETARDLPEGALSWSVADDRQATGGATDALVSQLQMLAGLGGAATLDFDAVDDAGDAVGEYAAFLAERLGTSRSVTMFEDGELRSESRTDIDW